MILKDCFYEEDPTAFSKKVASLLIHGDAAFAGQGIVTETFQLAKLPNYSVGGEINCLYISELNPIFLFILY